MAWQFFAALAVSWLLAKNIKKPKQETGVRIDQQKAGKAQFLYGEFTQELGQAVRTQVFNYPGRDDNKILVRQVNWSVAENGIESIDEVQLDEFPISDKKFGSEPQLSVDGSLQPVFKGGYYAQVYHSIDGSDINIKISSKAGSGYYENPVTITTDGTGVGDIANLTFEGKGCAFSVFVFTYDLEKMPSLPNITATGKGRKIENLLTGNIEYSNNPADIAYDYATHKNGGGLAPAFLRKADFIREREFCNTLVTEYQGSAVTRPIMTLNIRLGGDEQGADNLNLIRSSCRASMPDIDGQYAFTIERQRDPITFEINDSNRMSDLIYEDPDAKNVYTHVIIGYYAKEEKGQESRLQYPEDETANVAANKGISNPYDKLFEGINNHAEALQMAELIYNRSKNAKRGTISTTNEGKDAHVGDVVNLTSLQAGITTAKPFIIEEKTIKPNGVVEFSLIEYQESIYPWVVNPQPNFPDTTLPEVANVAAPTGLSVSVDNDGYGVLSWNSTYKKFIVEIDTGSELIDLGEVPNKSVRLPELPLGDYVFRVAAKNALGYTSNDSILEFEVVTPVAPTVSTKNDAISITVEPNLTGSYFSTYFELVMGLVDDVNDPANKNYGLAGNWTVNGLSPNTEYFIFVRTVNVLGNSAWNRTTVTTDAQAPNIVDAVDGLIDIDNFTPESKEQIEQYREDIDDNAYRLQIQSFKRKDSDIALLASVAKTAASRDELLKRIQNDEKLIDAVVEIDPLTGSIVNKAFAYTDTSFSEASLEINAVDQRVTATVESVSLLSDQVNANTSELELVPGQITATATSIVAEQIAALEPAHAFNFFDSAQSWAAVNGTLTTPTANQIDVTLWDIENDQLSFDATENPLIRITVERTAGSGWVGDLIIERSDTSTHTFSGIIEDIPTGGDIVRSIDLRGNNDWTGTINRIRIIGGASVADTFIIKSITIGKPDAYAQDIENLTARVTTAELDINSNTAAITQRVTVTDYNANTVTFSNVETTVDGLNSIINLQATRQQLIDDDTIAKANSASVTIDGYTGTITSLAQTVETNENDAESKFTSAFEEIDSTNGRITNQIFSITQNSEKARDSLIEQLKAVANYGLFVAGSLEKDITYGSAIETLKVDVSSEGALAKSITDLEVGQQTAGQQITANTLQIQQAETLINGNTEAISLLDARVEDNETFASAQLSLNATYESDIGIVSARAFLGTDVNNRVTGINIEGELTDGVISLIGDKIQFLRPTDFSVGFQWDATEGDFDYQGIVNITRGDSRVVISPNSDLMFWFGDKNIAAGSRTKSNGIFWIDSEGEYSRDVEIATISETSISGETSITSISTGNITHLGGLMESTANVRPLVIENNEPIMSTVSNSGEIRVSVSFYENETGGFVGSFISFVRYEKYLNVGGFYGVSFFGNASGTTLKPSPTQSIYTQSKVRIITSFSDETGNLISTIGGLYVFTPDIYAVFKSYRQS